MSNANKYYSDLLGYAISFDKQQMNKEALQQSITGMKNDAATVKTNLQGLNASDNKVIGALIAYYQTVESALAKAQNDMSEAALSSQIKEIYLEIRGGKGRVSTKPPEIKSDKNPVKVWFLNILSQTTRFFEYRMVEYLRLACYFFIIYRRNSIRRLVECPHWF